jgi:hypothetical protein
MNCDTRLAINLSMFELGEYDEFVFTIKNYDYLDSSYVFLFKARLEDIDEHGEVYFTIDPDTSKKIKSGAFYTLATLINASNPTELVEYKKLPGNGKVILEYGAHDFALQECEEPVSPFAEVINVRLEPIDDDNNSAKVNGTIVGIRLEACESEEC